VYDVMGDTVGGRLYISHYFFLKNFNLLNLHNFHAYCYVPKRANCWELNLSTTKGTFDSLTKICVKGPPTVVYIYINNFFSTNRSYV